MREGRYEHFPHDADVGVRGIGASLAESFEQAALALTAVVTDPKGIVAAERVELRCEAPDSELLLADFLNAVIYEMATRGMLFGRYEVRIEGGMRLEAAALGEPVDIAKHQPVVEVKGATLTSLRVEQQSSGTWLSQCVVDV